jgi:hypothetical protein
MRREIPIFLDGPAALSVWAVDLKDGNAPDRITVATVERMTRPVRFEDEKPLAPSALYGSKADYKRLRVAGRLPFGYVPYVLTETETVGGQHFDIAMRLIEALVEEQKTASRNTIDLIIGRLGTLERKVHALENNPLVEWAQTTIPQGDRG